MDSDIMMKIFSTMVVTGVAGALITLIWGGVW